jgi:DNA-binding GntR family transcriptional regulator
VIIALEELSSRLAAAAGAEHLPAIEAANQCFAASVERFAVSHAPDDAREVRDADDAFHGAILQATDNPYLSDALLPRKILARRYENWYFGNTPSSGAASVGDHARIIAALRAGDAERAAEETRRNWARSLSALSLPIERDDSPARRG